MSLSVNTNTSMISALTNMQNQLNTLKVAANNNQAVNSNLQANIPLAQAQNSSDVQKIQSADETVGEFASMLKSAFENVNIIQNESSAKQARFDLGDRSLTLADVMLASQKSSISFEATMQVRNKMVDAYKTIMQMQI